MMVKELTERKSRRTQGGGGVVGNKEREKNGNVNCVMLTVNSAN